MNMKTPAPKDGEKIHALINYEDPYVHPLILSALEKRLPSSAFTIITSIDQLPSPDSRLLQIVQYESIDFDHQLSHPTSSLANAYIIRKALIRKHYLSTTVANWITKYPGSVLARHVKPSVEFEVDYAEFLDDALVEAWELKESWKRNEEASGGEEEEEGRKKKEKEWWILKPGMSERGQGIRLFSSEEELTRIFEEWDPESEDEDEEDEDLDARSDNADRLTKNQDEENSTKGGIITSQLRHFIAQPYIHPPLLLLPPNSPSTSTSDPPSALRKFHIRTYVLAIGALKIYIYHPMLALFAARPYTPPNERVLHENRDEAMKAHLSNTCLQESGEREGSVGLFWGLGDEIPAQPLNNSTISTSTAINSTPGVAANWKAKIFKDICDVTAETFLASARSMATHFQPLPNAFEIFGLDFMISMEENGELRTWLLEVNAFPDFRQTGDELKGLVEGLWEGVVDVGVRGFFGVEEGEGKDDGSGGSGSGQGSSESQMVKVLDVDLGRR